MNKNWYVIQTKPRYEKKVFEHILFKDIEAYLPLIENIRYWSDRKKKVKEPLFPGYVFLNATDEERYYAISNNTGALRYLMFEKRPAILNQDEINNIKISLKAPEKISIEDLQISKGDIVEVTFGIFKGLKGEIVQLRGSYKLTVNIVELNTAISIQLNNSEVKLLQKYSLHEI